MGEAGGSMDAMGDVSSLSVAKITDVVFLQMVVHVNVRDVSSQVVVTSCNWLRIFWVRTK